MGVTRKMKTKMKFWHFVRNLLFISLTFLLLSLLVLIWLHEWPPSWPGTVIAVLIDSAKALMAASLIGLFVELAEVKNYFSQLIRNLVVDRGFVAELSDEELERHGIESLVC